MPGILPMPGNLSMDDLAGRLTKHEQLLFEEITALVQDPDATLKRNRATFVDQVNQTGSVAIVSRGAACGGKKIVSTNVYILGVPTDVDVYRMS